MIVSAKRLHQLKSGLPTPVGQGTGGTQKSPDFGHVLAQIRQDTQSAKVSADPFAAMRELTQRIESGTRISSKELLLYQIRAGEYGMRVELVSKLADSANSSLKRLQNQG